MEAIKNTDEYMRGMRDCKAGVTHTSQGCDYDRGYGVQFEIQEALSAGCFN